MSSHWITVGSESAQPHPRGKLLIVKVNLEGEAPRRQLMVVMGESTFEAWLESYRDLFGCDPSPDEIAAARQPRARFYRVSTD